MFEWKGKERREGRVGEGKGNGWKGREGERRGERRGREDEGREDR